MVLVHDYPVPKKSLEQLESIANDLRKRCGIQDAQRVDVFRLLFEAMPSYLKERGLNMISRSAGYMGDRDAYAVSKPNRIFYRPRLLAQLRMGIAIARVEFVHELAHILLHPGAAKAWVTAGNDIKSYIPAEESAEWQATTFALCVLVPRNLADKCQTAEELADIFGIDAEHAQKRFEQIAKRRARTVPSIYQDVRHQLTKAPTEPRYLNEQCSCGERKLIKIDSRYLCANCARVSDNFQDGELVNHDF